MQMTIYYRFMATYEFFSLNFTKDICNEVQWSKSNYKPDNEMSLVYNAFKNFSNMVRPCPYQVFILNYLK